MRGDSVIDRPESPTAQLFPCERCGALEPELQKANGLFQCPACSALPPVKHDAPTPTVEAYSDGYRDALLGHSRDLDGWCPEPGCEEAYLKGYIEGAARMRAIAGGDFEESTNAQ